MAYSSLLLCPSAIERRVAAGDAVLARAGTEKIHQAHGQLQRLERAHCAQEEQVGEQAAAPEKTIGHKHGYFCCVCVFQSASPILHALYLSLKSPL